MATLPGTERRTEAEAVAEIVKAGQAARTLSVEGRQYVILPQGQELNLIPREQEEPPLLIEQRPTFGDRESFVAYVERFRGENTLLVGDLDKSTIRALLDYHGPDAPSWNRHAATLQFRHSPEWREWTGKNRQLIPQLTFAEFLEDCIGEIASPDGAVISAAVKDLRARKNVQFRSAEDLQTGATVLEYVEEIEQQGSRKGNFRVPDRFTLVLRPYQHGTPVQVEARLRFRIADGSGALSFQFVLDRLEDVLEAAFRQEVEAVQQALGAKVLWGSV